MWSDCETSPQRHPQAQNKQMRECKESTIDMCPCTPGLTIANSSGRTPAKWSRARRAKKKGRRRSSLKPLSDDMGSSSSHPWLGLQSTWSSNVQCAPPPPPESRLLGKRGDMRTLGRGFQLECWPREARGSDFWGVFVRGVGVQRS